MSLAKALYRALNTSIRQEERSQINNLNFYIKKLRKRRAN